MLRSIGLAALGLIILECPCIAAQHRIEALTPAFGHSIAAGDSTLAIGDPSAASGSGMIWTYRQNPQGGWAPALTLQGTANDSLGYSLAADGHLLVAGAPGNRRTYFYDLRDNQLPQPLAFVTQDTDGYGRAVAIHSIYVAVGSPADQFGRGRIDLYIQSPQNEWDWMQTLHGESGGEAFGHALAMDSESSWWVHLRPTSHAEKELVLPISMNELLAQTGDSKPNFVAVLPDMSMHSAQALPWVHTTSTCAQSWVHLVPRLPTSIPWGCLIGSRRIHSHRSHQYPQQGRVPASHWPKIMLLSEPHQAHLHKRIRMGLRLDELGAGSRRVNLQGSTTFGHAIVAWKDHYAITEPGVAVHIFAKTMCYPATKPPIPSYWKRFPNPFTESITITLSSNAPDQLFITDVYGRLITSIASNGQNHIRWYPSALAAGMYIISVGKISKPIIRLP